MIEFVLIFLFIVIMVAIAIAITTHTNPTVDVNEPIKVKKHLKVTFADTRQERIFSKKTGKIKCDKIGKT